MALLGGRLVRQITVLQRVLPSVVRSCSTASTSDRVTHTGQAFEEDDYRLVRFTERSKQVNPHPAIDLIAQAPPKVCTQSVVSCDGGGGALGHPKVYINLDQPGNHSCGYCGLRFVKPDHH
ncbi:NADH dehydrogenase [ubiquinone] iron-sulfur protein 6, mitochondrial-like [Pollicipes pollicipes]|uniref:NADH dehydrogenase [ubiquinone] iron-sulfur protein 6, mitochondrial-like n=1 Tax=Pollicipes pollicipes TaxID=41117 RepID=UPI0018850CBF|nr:NADH dehydrogenase [ubiquinone] iron-sulfur protein 6, mitochondrial-like [Pollicipes pollicipes]